MLLSMSLSAGIIVNGRIGLPLLANVVPIQKGLKS